jgi:site-specific DNA recombinase
MAPKLNAPLAAYVRVSRVAGREGDSFHSPEEQRAAIERYAAAHDFELVHFEPELDVSGSKARRPVLDSILEGIKAGQLGGLVVFRLDRLSRLAPRDRVALFADVEDAGGAILSASEQLDTSTPEGRFQRELFLGLARMQWERYRDGFDRAKASAMERGAAIGPTPFGYARAADGSLVEHPEDGPALREAFRLAARESLDAALAFLAEHGGRTWTASTVRRLLGKTSYLGEHRYGSLRAQVPKLVDRATWEAAQPEPVKRRRPRADFPLSGSLECGTCGSPMVGARGGADGRRMYRCSAGLKTHRGEPCSKPVAVSADRLEAWAVERVNADLAQLFAELPSIETQAGGGVEEAEAALIAAEEERATFAADLRARGLMGDDLWYATLERHAAAVEAAREAFTAAAKAAQRRTISFEGRELTLADVADMARRQEIALAVSPGRGKPIEERAAVAFGPSLTIRTAA